VVQPQPAAQMIDQFLGGAVGPITTPPLDAYGNPQPLPVTTTTTAPPVTASTAPPTTGATTPTTTVAQNAIPSYDPRPC
jgi:hypothetical protein